MYFYVYFLLSRSLPLEVLHTIVLGACKYLLQNIMSVLSARQKEEVLARVRAFNTSGFKVKMYGNVCRHYKSFVGRDFKGWAQMALFIVGPYLNDGQKQVLLTFSKVNTILRVQRACINFFVSCRYFRLHIVNSSPCQCMRSGLESVWHLLEPLRHICLSYFRSRRPT